MSGHTALTRQGMAFPVRNAQERSVAYDAGARLKLLE
jgi:hypothetical protein